MQDKSKKSKKMDSMEYENTELNTENLKDVFGNSEDLVFKSILINNNKKMPVSLLYINGLTNQAHISDYVLKPLIQDENIKQAKKLEEVITLIDEGAIYFSSQTKVLDINKAISEVTSGSVILIFDKQKIAFAFDTKGFEKRAITEPTLENVNKASKDAFVETFRVNTATIRRKIRTHNIRIEQLTIGEQTCTKVGVVYIDGLTNRDTLNEVIRRLNAIDIDNVLTTSCIEEFLSDDISNPFPQVLITERPDKFCSEIVEGRVGVIADGLPVGFIVPGTMIQFMQAPEDYSYNHIISTLVRGIRNLAFILALFLPGFYIAVTTFQPEMIPTSLALFIAKSRQGVPLPLQVETLAMLIALELIFEASLRIPKNIGQAVSIVGTLIVGQAAVEAHLISPAVVIVTAVTSISTYAMPNQDFGNAIRIWRLIITFCSSLLGLIGLSMSAILLLYKMCLLNSYGIPYMSPLVDSVNENVVENSLIRTPIKNNKKRPESLHVSNVKKQGG